MISSDLEKIVNFTEIMQLKDVGIHINRKDPECIKRWLKENDITIHRPGRLTFIYRIDFECAMILPHIKDFRRRYPAQWEAYFQKTIKDVALFNLLLLKLEVDVNYEPATKVKIISKSDEKLYNKLLA